MSTEPEVLRRIATNGTPSEIALYRAGVPVEQLVANAEYEQRKETMTPRQRANMVLIDKRRRKRMKLALGEFKAKRFLASEKGKAP